MSRAVLVACAAGAVGLSGCSSTTEKASKFADEGSKAFEAKGLEVATVNASVAVKDTQIIRDANGTAAVITLRNTGTAALQDVPVALDVADRSGRSIWKNDAAGLETTLTSVPVLARGTTTTWINDQVLPSTGTAAAVKARVGAAEPAPGPLPKISVAPPELEGDPVDGVVARGELTNGSKVEQKDLVVYGLARKGGKVVAAGRAIVPRVRPGAKARYAIFFIGDPRGAALEVTAPPTTFKDAG